MLVEGKQRVNVMGKADIFYKTRSFADRGGNGMGVGGRRIAEAERIANLQLPKAHLIS